ncbi:MAG TPA: ABC transporter permease [Myxococcales bacterium]|nr:ABC transporter permease [Myxococcales bacterium]
MSESALAMPLQVRAQSIGARQKALRFLGELREAVLQAAYALRAHRLRATLTISGIGLGIAMLIGILTVLSGFQTSFLRQLNTLGPNTLFVHKWKWGVDSNEWWKYKNRPVVTQMDWRALEANTTLPEAIAPIVSTDASVTYGGKELKHVDIRGSTWKYLQATGWQIRTGRFLTEIDQELGTDSCIIGADVEDAFFKGQDPLGQRLRVGPLTRCTVVGTFMRKGNAFGQTQDLRVLIPLSAFTRTFGLKRGVVLAVVAPAGKMLETEDEVTAAMRNARHLQPDQEDNFSVNRQDKLLQGFNQMTLALNVVGVLIGIITAVVGGIGIMNILLVSVKERTREIGVRRALGARRTTILLQFLCEAVMVSSMGGFVGVAVGAGAGKLVDVLTPFPASVDPRVVIGGVLGSILLGAIFGIWPALSAAFLQPVEALRYE